MEGLQISNCCRFGVLKVSSGVKFILLFAAEDEQQTADENFVNSLNARISEMGSVRESLDDSDSAASSVSFQSISDDDLAASFNSRLGQVSSSGTPEEPLTGRPLYPRLNCKPDFAFWRCFTLAGQSSDSNLFCRLQGKYCGIWSLQSMAKHMICLL